MTAPDAPAAAASLSADDVYYLHENLEMAVDGGPDDPQTQRVCAVEHNVIELDCPVWTIDEAREQLRLLADAHELRVKVVIRDEPRAAAYVGRGGGVIQLRPRTSGEYRPIEDGQALGLIVLHEFAHLLTPHIYRRAERYGTRAFQSHGPEFVATYLHVLRGHVDTRRAEDAYALLGVDIAPLPEGVR